MNFVKSIFFAGIVSLFLSSTLVAQQTGSLSGQVVDALGNVVVGATVTAISADGKEKTTSSNQRGEYTIASLTPGTYIVRVIADKFAFFENPAVDIKAGPRTDFTATLTVAAMEQKVDVSPDMGVSTDPENNGDSTVLKEKDIEALPDDPDELEAALQALAGPSAGPNGGQIYIDGFTGGRLPPKDAIREIRINQNPFSAEYDRLGFGRIEILTKPGSDKWRGSAFGNFNDESLNSRNPFSANRAPSQTRFFGGNISGPIQKKKSSFFLDISNRDQDSNAVVNALILDPNLNPVIFDQEFLVPTRRFSVSPRFDYQINDKNTLVARYSFTRSSFENQGIGGISLPSRASSSTSVNHEFRLTETMIINPTTVNETRFQYEFNNRNQTGDNSIPTIGVADAFTGGGSQIGLSFNKSKDIEISNFTTTTLGKTHGVKVGGRFHYIKVDDQSQNGYGGSFSFPGSPELRSPAGCTPTGPPDPNCVIVQPALTSLDQYVGKIL
ncbi:MAG: carboxypeptidase regulatory-like domain-containing protein, partial [Acidobacteriota bacterium]